MALALFATAPQAQSPEETREMVAFNAEVTGVQHRLLEISWRLVDADDALIAAMERGTTPDLDAAKALLDEATAVLEAERRAAAARVTPDFEHDRFDGVAEGLTGLVEGILASINVEIVALDRRVTLLEEGDLVSEEHDDLDRIWAGNNARFMRHERDLFEAMLPLHPEGSVNRYVLQTQRSHYDALLPFLDLAHAAEPTDAMREDAVRAASDGAEAVRRSAHQGRRAALGKVLRSFGNATEAQIYQLYVEGFDAELKLADDLSELSAVLDQVFFGLEETREEARAELQILLSEVDSVVDTRAALHQKRLDLVQGIIP